MSIDKVQDQMDKLFASHLGVAMNPLANDKDWLDNWENLRKKATKIASQAEARGREERDRELRKILDSGKQISYENLGMTLIEAGYHKSNLAIHTKEENKLDLLTKLGDQNDKTNMLVTRT